MADLAGLEPATRRLKICSSIGIRKGLVLSIITFFTVSLLSRSKDERGGDLKQRATRICETFLSYYRLTGGRICASDLLPKSRRSTL